MWSICSSTFSQLYATAWVSNIIYKHTSRAVVLGSCQDSLPGIARPSSQSVDSFLSPDAKKPFRQFCSRWVFKLCKYCINFVILFYSLSLSSHFNGHFPGEPGLASVCWSKGDVSGADNWSYKTCKAPVKSSPPTNQHPFYSLSLMLLASCAVSNRNIPLIVTILFPSPTVWWLDHEIYVNPVRYMIVQLKI